MRAVLILLALLAPCLPAMARAVALARADFTGGRYAGEWQEWGPGCSTLRKWVHLY